MLRLTLAIFLVVLVAGTAWAQAHRPTSQHDWGPELSEIFHFQGTGPCACPRY